ncbi:histidine kinase [Salmonella enterica subsp. enterica serovar Legon]|uniref:ATP-binding protein n=1 Tax=Salmonella enterica TaxID=28901 RepID=UPI000D3EB61E|nr:ATP-binding protein [Salmonella enterica]PVB76068.1 histidine kinase [Salmonella enterica subsp. enterica serovar Legon]PVB88686.1 histidine kinase [Salmonella enterica subsp. enterica serovar Legon]PVB92306.1 histidine kinase [Salmonella enterica subsp. enterica serovar Legon]PVB98555.1 histidine kinase [Salmonella enterica subsp. enterica serovar Legon]PVC06226.1 histidine kinase [Salmonella enterica subsp. enterica serovar Legon]
MQTRNLTFKARARTIEHLGKGQIADCPTAISELWKNSYDAYARDVALYTIDGEHPCGALIDNGCGMSVEQLVDNWLIVGTESKTKKKALSKEDRFGLPIRKTQGEKGIGRLSAAFLSPVTYLVTKRVNGNFTALLIDWRLFENPYLSFEDIIIPSAEFESLDDANNILFELIKQLKVNIAFDENAEESEDQIFRRDAWARFSEDEKELSKFDDFITTQEKILNFCVSVNIPSEIYSPWEDILRKTEDLDGGKHGTALFLLELGRELSLLTNTGDLAKDNAELIDIEQSLVDTLRGFVNPYVEIKHSFSYEIFSVRKNGYHRPILSQTDVFGKNDFDALEHTVVGKIDNKGWFRGKVKSFGEERGEVIIPSNISVSEKYGVGPFDIRIGTFEIMPKNTTHSEREHTNLEAKAKKYAGLMVFRDDLRVLPYGRVDNDFFQIEERRSLNAGRYYWSNRRIFGYIGISQDENRELKDKSGREGFIRNQAARELKNIVSDLLKVLADKYFGRESDERKEHLEQVKKERELRKAAQQQARKSTQKSFSEALKKQTPILNDSLNNIINLKQKIDSVNNMDINLIRDIDDELSNLDSIRVEIKTPTKPPKLGPYEDKYRDYRDKYNEFSAYVLQMKLIVNKLDSELNKLEPSQLAKRHLEKNQGIINSRLTKFISSITDKNNLLLSKWNSEVKEERSVYYSKCISLVDDVKDGSAVEQTLNLLDSIFIELTDSLTFKYQSILKGMDRLLEGVNLDSAFSMSEEERAYFEEKTRSLNALAQLGISVEILSHELEEMDALVSRGLNSLPTVAKEHPGYELALNAHKSLTQQIRFLSPLKISGYQSRQQITGKNIHDHIFKFFNDRFERQRVDIKFGDDFLKISIVDLPSRIYPVFINIINNALYWVCLSESRVIHIDCIGNLVIIANSGPAVDEDDIPKLFELFYSKRANGHGVGLYLCRENLSVAHHKIWYSNVNDGGPYLIRDGANFVLEFNGLEM